MKPIVKKVKKDPPTIKRGPGRPRVGAKGSKVDRLGVKNTPLNDDHSIEFYYAIPIQFKRIFALYKSEGVKDVTMSFTKTKITFLAKSYSDEAVMKTFIDCTKCHRYYCDEPEEITVSREIAEKVINRIESKFYDCISFVVKHYTGEINQMIILLRNPMLDAISSHDINVSHLVDTSDDESWDETDYPLSFKFTKGNFKKYITDIETIGNELTIEKTGKFPLKFKYNAPVRLAAGESFPDDKIDLKCVIRDTEIIAASVKVKEIKLFCGAQLADEVTIYVDRKKKMMFIFTMDEAIETRILVNINDYRDELNGKIK